MDACRDIFQDPTLLDKLDASEKPMRDLPT